MDLRLNWWKKGMVSPESFEVVADYINGNAKKIEKEEKKKIERISIR